ncbi:DUF1272 domain-containing protein [Sorangium sp. So ce1128]
MLQLNPTCEHCNKPLPPNSLEARICSFECTFCATCVDEVLKNVCPNCGGNFCQRPIRPAKQWVGQVCLGSRPAGTVVKHRPVDVAAHAEFAARVGKFAPEDR